MNGLTRVIQSEPTLIVGFINAIVAVLVLYGVPITNEQAAGIIVVVNMALAIGNRMMVTPVAKAEAQAQDAADHARAKVIVEQAMTPAAEMPPAPTPEEWATVQELRAERDRLQHDAGRG